jgi:hypothetical protein
VSELFAFVGADSTSERALAILAVLTVVGTIVLLVACLWPVRDERAVEDELPPAGSIAAYRSAARQVAAKTPDWVLWDSTDEHGLSEAEKVLLRQGYVRIPDRRVVVVGDGSDLTAQEVQEVAK